MDIFWIIKPFFSLDFILIYLIVTVKFSQSLDDYGDSPEIIKSRGFNCEIHKIVTSDGYILTMFRIVNPLIVKQQQLRKPPNRLVNNYKPIILQSGLGGSSDDYIFSSPDGQVDESLLNNPNVDQLINYYNGTGRNLGFLLANLGYDVWLTNFRANYYSRNHTTLDPDSTEFWTTGLDEMATIDLPTTIDYILNSTKRKTVGYIGLSRGCAVMFALLSERLEYTEKVKPFIAMAPAVFVGRWSVNLFKAILVNVNSLLRYLARKSPVECFGRGFPKKMYQLCHNSEFNPFCSIGQHYLSFLLGDHTNLTRMGIYLTHFPAGSPCLDYIHYFQIGLSGRFHKLDYGEKENYLRYNQSSPPDYPLEKIRSKDIYIFNSKGDKLVTPNNVVKLVDKLKVKPKEWKVINRLDFDHLDFIFSLELGVEVNRDIVRILSYY
ncbi:gastric triacylglycerol lipase-like [Panonychus citri]|uniref:gastric triacylglycerol lipase-like n=1 Tax=Panonychus citri TaxID=50023 RepID=UPI002307B9DB|nr:gastric triacylglycerol lipase-like [Panonychus citri]